MVDIGRALPVSGGVSGSGAAVSSALSVMGRGALPVSSPTNRRRRSTASPTCSREPWCMGASLGRLWLSSGVPSTRASQWKRGRIIKPRPSSNTKSRWRGATPGAGRVTSQVRRLPRTPSRGKGRAQPSASSPPPLSTTSSPTMPASGSCLSRRCLARRSLRSQRKARQTISTPRKVNQYRAARDSTS